MANYNIMKKGKLSNLTTEQIKIKRMKQKFISFSLNFAAEKRNYP